MNDDVMRAWLQWVAVCFLTSAGIAGISACARFSAIMLGVG